MKSARSVKEERVFSFPKAEIDVNGNSQWKFKKKGVCAKQINVVEKMQGHSWLPTLTALTQPSVQGQKTAWDAAEGIPLPDRSP